jgi:hypothetical protein
MITLLKKHNVLVSRNIEEVTASTNEIAANDASTPGA